MPISHFMKNVLAPGKKQICHFYTLLEKGIYSINFKNIVLQTRDARDKCMCTLICAKL